MPRPRIKTLLTLACAVLLFAIVPLAAVAEGFRIDSVDYRITGLTLKAFLADYLKIEKDKLFPDRDSLAAYVDALHRSVINNRVFDESSSVTWEPAGEGDPVPVRIIVSVNTTGSALAVPFPKYSSTEGLSMALRYKDFNFLGTLEPLSLNFDYYFESKEISAASYFTLYMNMLRARWAFAVAGDIIYYPDIGVKPNGTASISSTYRFDALGQHWYASPLLYYLYERDYLRHTITGGVTTGFGFHAGLDWSFSAYTNVNDQYVTSHYPYMNNGVGLSTSIPLAAVPFLGTLSFSPSTGFFGTFGIEKGRYTDVAYSLGANLYLGRVDLARNLRKGATFNAGVYYADHFIAAAPTDSLDLSVNVNASAHYPISDLIGIDFRFTGYWFGTWTLVGENPSFDWSTYIRGKKPYLYGDLGAIANLQFPLNFAQGRFFVSDRFTAEVHLIPFVDAGYVRRDPADEFPRLNDAILCAGLDAAVFPLYARAFTYRLSVGYDIMDYISTKDISLSGVEVWLGLGLHF